MTDLHQSGGRATPFNDEEPSPDAMSRLWDALDATLDPPRAVAGTSGTHECLRCGWRWTPRDLTREPRSCANPRCHSTYWDRPAMTARGRRPDQVNLDLVRVAITADRARYRLQRRINRVRAEARTLGLRLERLPGEARRRPKMTITEAATPSPTPTSTMPPIATNQQQVPYRPTVPPPPGLGDLEAK